MKKLLIGFLIVSLLMVGVVASASADWTDTAEASYTMDPGITDINCNAIGVTLDGKLYPGYVGTFYVKVDNDGDCPVKITATVINAHSVLNITVEPFNDIVAALGSHTFKFTVEMLTTTGIGYQNLPLGFKIEFAATSIGIY